MACPQDSVWEGALEALNHYPITTKDKSEGIIETDWRTQPVPSRGFGLFNRQIGEKERSQLTFSMKPLQEGIISIKLTERRHHWGFVGGQQLYKWYPVEPSEHEVNNFMNRLTAKLDKEGCIVES